MAEEKKSAYRHALEAAGRFKRQLDSAKEQGEMIAGEVMRTGISAATAFGAGLLDERYGTAGADGIRVHKVNGAPTALLAGAALKVTAGFGLYGKFQSVGFSAGDGAISHTSSTWGRMGGARLRAVAERQNANASKAPASLPEAAPTASQAVAAPVAAERVAV